MTLLEFIDKRPVWSLFYLLIVCVTVSGFAQALATIGKGRR